MLSSISGFRDTGREQEWSNGTEFSGYFPEFSANLGRYTQNFGIKFREMSVPFALPPILVPIALSHLLAGRSPPRKTFGDCA